MDKLNNIGVIGAGNMASAIVKGIISRKIISPEKILVFDIDSNKLSKLADESGVSIAINNSDLVEKADIIFIAVKPNAYNIVLNEIKSSLCNEKIIISIAAGVGTEFIKNIIDNKCKVVRIMPNTPALIGEGVIAMCRNKDLNITELDIINEILCCLGMVEEIDETLINAVIGVSGSGPAYVYMFIEAMADGAVMMGLPREQAYRMAAHTVLGSAKMILESSNHPGELKDMVCSPGGTTIEAVYSLEKNCFRGSVMEAVKVCALKGERMNSK